MTENGEKLLELIREEEKKGKAVFYMIDQLVSMDIDDLINQPTEGLLYDLNRDKVTCATWIANETVGWVNNYAVALVITRLKELVDEAQRS